jgi:hypothetical protein
MSTLPSVSPGLAIGFIIAALGMGLLFLLAKGLSGGRMLRVPDGEAPDHYYRQWKAGALGKKISRGMVFVGFAAVAMMLGGLGVMLLSWGTK